MNRIGMPELIVVCGIAAMALVVIWPASTICRRVGLSPWLGVLAAVPIANVLLLWFVALAEWPRAQTGPQSV
jgi:hypothetical protein